MLKSAAEGKFADEIRSKALAYSGELLMSDIMNEVLCERGIASKAVSFDFWPIITDNNIESTNFLYSESEQHLPEILRLIETYSVITMGGFIGKTTDGIVTTYERGGSDRTAVDMGILLHKKFNVSINFEKDFAVYSADPRIVKDGSMINELSYNEARLAATFGISLWLLDQVFSFQKKKMAASLASLYAELINHATIFNYSWISRIYCKIFFKVYTHIKFFMQ